MRKQGAADKNTRLGVKVEPRPYAIRPAGVAQVGVSIGTHVTGRGKEMFGAFERVKDGSGYSPPAGPTSGAGQGPGANRTTHPRGSQGKR
jgi:hypothetical protein